LGGIVALLYQAAIAAARPFLVRRSGVIRTDVVHEKVL
jgi:hypothetical protein